MISALAMAHLVVPAPLDAQLLNVRAEENFRAEPNGTVLGRLLPGTVLELEERGEGWLQATLEGWMWTPSLRTRASGAFDLVVSAEEGENLRVEPSGTILARLEPGTLLEEVERGAGWIHVRRTGWIWSASVEEVVRAGPEAGGDAPDPVADAAAVARTAGPATGGGPALTVPADGLPLLGAPGGDTVATLLPGSGPRVLGRRGSWVRVRMEGWAWLPEEAGDTVSAAEAGGPVDATPDEVRENPDRYVGRVVTWSLQYVGLERAEAVRPDFYEGEPFILARPPSGAGPFVYVAVPPERIAAVERLTPLERITVVGRVRVGASELTGSPIIDLLELRSGRRRP